MQAKDPQVPLAEKLSFISIYQTNLDEFFMVRIGSLYDQMLFYPDSKDNKTGMTGLEQLKACLKKVHYLNKKKDRTPLRGGFVFVFPIVFRPFFPKVGKQSQPYVHNNILM